MTLTPDEARRLQQGNSLETELPRIRQVKITERLRDELSRGVYTDERQQQAFRRLLVAWDGTEKGMACPWIHYMESVKALYVKNSALFAAKYRNIDVFDYIDDCDFWVRAMAASAVFSKTAYAIELMREHTFEEAGQLEAA